MNILSDELKIHTGEYENIKHIIPVINKETKVCTGLMAHETSFIGSFTNLELDKLFNVYEIPPFGDYFNTSYSNLNIKKINCLFISNSFKNSEGGGHTNQKIRYDNYIKYYSDYLIKLGAVIHKIPNTGELIIFNSNY
jgi:hypothetical protein